MGQMLVQNNRLNEARSDFLCQLDCFVLKCRTDLSKHPFCACGILISHPEGKEQIGNTQNNVFLVHSLPIPHVADTCKTVPLHAVLFHSEIKSQECPADVTVRIQEKKDTGTPQKCHQIMDSNRQHNDNWPSLFIALTWVYVGLSVVVSKISNFKGGIQMPWQSIHGYFNITEPLV